MNRALRKRAQEREVAAALRLSQRTYRAEEDARLMRRECDRAANELLCESSAAQELALSRQCASALVIQCAFRSSLSLRARLHGSPRAGRAYIQDASSVAASATSSPRVPAASQDADCFVVISCL